MDNYEKIIAQAKKIFQKARKSHDWDHTRRVSNLCLYMGEIENADMEVLQLAAILHDIGREEQDASEGRVCHAAIGAVMAQEILEEHGLPGDKIDKVVHCIATHRFRGGKAPLSKEAKILFDADKLDAIGAIGIGRAFVFAGEVGAKVHNKDVDVEQTKAYSEEDTAYREYLVKLRKIKDNILTAEGKKLAEGRHQFMVGFFNRLNKEVDGEL